MKKSLLFLFACCSLQLSHAQSAAITIDGLFNDWTPDLAGLADNPENLNGIDLLEFQVSNDADFLYLRLLVDQEIDLTDNLVNHSVYLYLDTDNNAATGFNAAPGMGAEIGINFYSRIVFANYNPNTQVIFSDIKFRALPTVTGNEFELAIGRNELPDGINPTFLGSTMKILFREQQSGDYLPNSGSSFVYTFDETPVNPIVPIEINKENPEAIRVCGYNINGAFTNASLADEFQRILPALDADIYCFSEASNTTAGAVKTQLDTWVPTGLPNGWYTTEDDYDMIVASKWPFSGSWSYLNRQYGVLVDLPVDYTHDFLISAAHYNCCTADATRQNQADEFIEFVLDARSPGGVLTVAEGTPIALVGDMNFVGWAQQLTTVLTGDIQNEATYGPGGAPDWDNTSFADALPIQTDKRTAYTWRNDNSNFPAGRLDFIIYSDAVLSLEKAFTLQTEVMSAPRLAQYGLLLNDTRSLTDHFPVVADFVIGLPVDSDGDGIEDSGDNCPDIANPDQADFNNDGIGDSCSDMDNDQLNDAEEINLGTNPLVQDSDGDGITDYYEVVFTLSNPTNPDSNNNGIGDLFDLYTDCPNCPGDLTGDGVINTNDLLSLLALYGTVCE
jgi:endonuclease/exonuclease/phosphatase family metal-dependent hydrolase